MLGIQHQEISQVKNDNLKVRVIEGHKHERFLYFK